ncbi:MAG: protein-L-isoaspartate O-methyltransferase [Holophagales bacterium]|nr:protein-L-isoaspartate O-methyltransferase [Holophagales bacterium]MXX61840.1 protein-L-isoaspartate O-methyltransferase [Holophagales bacterium]MYC10974.1 protein-L-isoaspartate O-methyltransferase [Holophagales bacterium]MYD21604.1 protein-L-isoaspartate O-methyltransferase [Holophagales bacterium]MYI31728.1 protein-L-isoaspartate O-methyltransferase [Holophagales bacterium]
MIGYVLGRSMDRADLDVHRVVNVIGGVPGVARHHFVPAAEQVRAYRGPELPIGRGRTTPDSYIVALMAELAVPPRTTPTLPVLGHKVLEVGTGSGYLAAVLSEMVERVYTIEPDEALAQRAAATLGDFGYGNVTVGVGEPFEGWPEFAPFDSIVVKGPVDPVPQTLIDQLALGGKLVGPVGSPDGPQVLQVLEKLPDGSVAATSVLEVRFPPLTSDD